MKPRLRPVSEVGSTRMVEPNTKNQYAQRLLVVGHDIESAHFFCYTYRWNPRMCAHSMTRPELLRGLYKPYVFMIGRCKSHQLWPMWDQMLRECRARVVTIPEPHDHRYKDPEIQRMMLDQLHHARRAETIIDQAFQRAMLGLSRLQEQKEPPVS